eukprot:TRINITY_DN111663_c0_g1_i1.p1 TRINITY_DN111663_c0_g1~~TRINITY_DN111663_c0_g1_i1.p1  ORF type:complete len:315 (-),score=30.34 TRINITY_DN111663_c0_g1_i1:50-931(-)
MATASLLPCWLPGMPRHSRRGAGARGGQLARRTKACDSDIPRGSPRGVKFQERTGPDSEGRYQASVHPKALNVGQSALRLGGVDWREVRRLAAGAEAGAGMPCAQAVFQILGEGQPEGQPLRFLLDSTSLSLAYAALLTDKLVKVQWREEVLPRAEAVALQGSRLRDSHYGSEAYCSRKADAARCPSGPCGVFLAQQPQPNSLRHLALVDPKVLRAHRRMTQPRWPKAWAFAKRMLGGDDDFPPVRITWRDDRKEWHWRDGCHRYFAALVSGKYLRVSFREPVPVEQWGPPRR